MIKSVNININISNIDNSNPSFLVGNVQNLC